MISFIVPVYNKGSVLFQTLNSLIQRLHHSQISDFEIIVVNDGSTDNSFEEMVRCKQFNGDTKKIKIYHYTKNIGKGFALRYGFYRSSGDPVVFLDADVDIDTRQVLKALKKYSTGHPDMVIGSKYLPASRTSYPVLRYAYSLVLKLVIFCLFHLNVSDTQVGLKVFRRSVLSEIFPRVIIKRFAVDLELLVVARMLNFRHISEVPVIIKHTSAGRSTVDLWAVKNFCQDVLAIFYRKNVLHFYEHERTALIPTVLDVQVA